MDNLSLGHIYGIKRIIRTFCWHTVNTHSPIRLCFLHLPSDVMVSSLCWTCCAIMRLMLIRFSVMSLVVWARPSLVIFLQKRYRTNIIIPVNCMIHKPDPCLYASHSWDCFSNKQNTLSAYLCLTALSAPLRSACFSILSMDSLLARLAFLQTVWLLQKQPEIKINKIYIYFIFF